ncbi:MAG: ABC transporter ATP-binding protein [Gemmatimonadales bacterium]|nr:ABC transporter ATP-binding protein [Gemmatimonadales bacterium]
MKVLRFEDVWFSYGDEPVLKGVSLAVEPGETVALLGRNGAGKTTLTKLVMALLHPDRGYVWVGDRVTQDRTPEQMASRAAYVFQHADQQLFARTVWGEVAFAPRQLGLEPHEVERVVADALRRVGLDRSADQHPYDLPSPQRKLVTLAAAIAQQPRVLVLDEPTQGLDALATQRVVQALQALAAEGVAVLAVTHDLGFVTEALDRALVLGGGTIVYDGPAADLVTDEERAMALGLGMPAQVRLSLSLGLAGRPLRAVDVAAALRRHSEAGGPVREEF